MTYANPLAALNALLEKATATASKNDKQAIVSAAINAATPEAEEIRSLLNLALSPYVCFYIGKLPPASDVAWSIETGAERYVQAMSLFKALSDRSLSGTAAKKKIGDLLVALPAGERYAFERVLMKDLKAGFSESTVNKARPKTVAVFSCQLAPSELANPDTIDYPCELEPKYDGVRTLIRKVNGRPLPLSRNGLPFDNFEEIEIALAGMPDDVVLDGEVITVDFDITGKPRTKDESFNALMKRAGGDRGKNVDVVPVLIYKVFDAIPAADFDALKCDLGLDQRKLLANEAVTTARDVKVANCPDNPGYNGGLLGSVTRTKSFTCNNAADVNTFYETLVADGYEGAMVKGQKGKYTFKRNDTWQKIKPFKTTDLRITGFVEGEGDFVGTLGAVLMEGEEEGKAIKTKVGSGFSRKLRDDIWSDQAGFLNTIGEIKFQGVSLAEGETVHSLRFPTWKRARSLAGTTAKV